MEDVYFSDLRREMVELIAAHAAMVRDHMDKDAIDDRVMAAMAKVPRHEFVPVELRRMAYLDNPLPIGFEKTISQPFIVAFMTDLLGLEPHHRVLEIGTGLGYQAAVLGELARTVYSVEIIGELAGDARRRLDGQGYDNVESKVSNGYYGWPEQAPFDAIMVTAAPDLIPPPLFGQLKPGGRMVIPAGIEKSQQLMVVSKNLEGNISTREVLPVVFSALASAG
ncbi:MAG: protein-L-isoaspartate(D-aspartate) O-methyltransferase [Alphaproteobacteria bacterium]